MVNFFIDGKHLKFLLIADSAFQNALGGFRFEEGVFSMFFFLMWVILWKLASLWEGVVYLTLTEKKFSFVYGSTCPACLIFREYTWLGSKTRVYSRTRNYHEVRVTNRIIVFLFIENNIKRNKCFYIC